MKVRLLDIFLLFLKTGGLLFGGGGVIVLPLLEEEAVKKRGWLTSEELIEYYAISQVIPGLNIPDVSMFIGYKLRGKLGAIVAGIGIILIPFFLIISLAVFLDVILRNQFVKSAFWGVETGIIIILINAIRTIWKSSIVDKFSLLFFTGILLTIVFTKSSPAWIVFTALLFGVVKGLFAKEEERENL